MFAKKINFFELLYKNVNQKRLLRRKYFWIKSLKTSSLLLGFKPSNFYHLRTNLFRKILRILCAKVFVLWVLKFRQATTITILMSQRYSNLSICFQSVSSCILLSETKYKLFLM